MGNIGHYFFGDLPKIKKIWHFKFLLTQDHMGKEISKHYFSKPSVFIRSHPSFVRTFGYQVWQILWHFEMLIWKSIGNPRIILNILKTDDGRVKRMNIWDLQCWELHMWGTFYVRFFEFSLGSFGTLCKISDVKTFKRLLSNSFHPIFSNLYYKYCSYGGI